MKPGAIIELLSKSESNPQSVVFGVGFAQFLGSSLTMNCSLFPSWSEEMLDPWIIDEIRKREEYVQEEQPMLEIPLERPEAPDQAVQDEDEADRGVEIVDYGI